MIIQATDVKIKYNNLNGAWHIAYRGPSGVYKLDEHGRVGRGASIKEVYQAASWAVLAASYLFVPPLCEIEIEIIDEI